MSQVYNFNPGPAVLPKEVFEKASQAVLNYEGTGLSVLEISHRSPECVAMFERAEKDLREIMNIPDDYAVLFLHGGASTQFLMVPMNLLPDGETADYVETGSWAKKAIKEAKNFGNVNVAGSSADTTYTFIPKELKLSSGAKYLHITSNNTIYGTQYNSFPESDAPLVADMSSDILSREINVNDFGIIYAGAQKNMGPAGVAISIVKKDLLGNAGRKIPTMMDYATHIDKASMFNTPPVFAVYIVSEVLNWVKAQGGVKAVQAVNERKAKKLYDAIDASSLFKGAAEKGDRSNMNVTFVIGDDEKEKKFVSGGKERGLVGLKGHRSVGGFRASIYNAMAEEGIDALVTYMHDFEKENG